MSLGIIYNIGAGAGLGIIYNKGTGAGLGNMYIIGAGVRLAASGRLWGVPHNNTQSSQFSAVLIVLHYSEV